jgi:hypothetical protein
MASMKANSHASSNNKYSYSKTTECRSVDFGLTTDIGFIFKHTSNLNYTEENQRAVLCFQMAKILIILNY